MDLSLNSIEELKMFATPVEELIKEKPFFQELNSIKDILIPIEDLSSKKEFLNLQELSDIFTPINK